MKLKNGSQVAARPSRVPTVGSPGYFANSNDSGAPSYPGQDWFNDIIDELNNAFSEAGVAYDSSKLTNLATAFVKLKEDSTSKANAALAAAKTDASAKDTVVLTTAKAYVDTQIRSIRLLEVSGTENAIILTTPASSPAVTELNDYDEFSFIVNGTNTGFVTIKIDDLAASPLASVVAGTQVFETALITVRYIAGSFYIVDQVNPKTGNSVLDIAKLWTDTVDILRPGEYALDGTEISNVDHPIACAIAAASSNYIAQAAKDAEPIKYGGYYGFVDELDGSTTVTLPMVGGEFIRMFDHGRGVNPDQEFGEQVADELRSHSHITSRFQTGVALGDTYRRNLETNGSTSTGSTGGSETRPRSIAYYGKTRL